MKERTELDFYTCANEAFLRMRNGGVLCTVVDAAGNQNLLTLGWGWLLNDGWCFRNLLYTTMRNRP
jgi:hypothetical protein